MRLRGLLRSLNGTRVPFIILSSAISPRQLSFDSCQWHAILFLALFVSDVPVVLVFITSMRSCTAFTEIDYFEISVF